MATMKDVARLSGASITTVSRVINNNGYVNKATEAKVRAAIEKLNYSPNQAARSLIYGETQTIGLILPDIVNPFFPAIARAVEDIAQQDKYSVIFCNSDNDILKVNKYVKILKEKAVDGIIIAGEMKRQHLEELLNHHTPLVMLDVNSDFLPVNSVRCDNRYGGLLATKHLIEQGYSRIAHIRGPLDSSSAEARYDGFLDALKENGIPYDPTLVQIGDFHVESGYTAMLRLLAHLQKPDAVFIGNDLMALGALEAICEAKLKVPLQMGIVGFDDIPLTKVVNPKLSTVKQPIYEIGVKATELLLKTIKQKGKLQKEYIKEVIKPTLVVRETSCLSPPEV